MRSTDQIRQLIDLGRAFRKEKPSLFRGRPDDLLLSSFCSWLQAGGADMSMWGEGQWTETLLSFGYPEKKLPDLLEQMASWGVTDSSTWLSSREKAES